MYYRKNSAGPVRSGKTFGISILWFLFLSFMIMSVSSCDSRATKSDQERIEKQAAEADAFQTFCESEDCSRFPEGYHSARIKNQWYFLPLPGRVDGKLVNRGTVDPGASGDTLIERKSGEIVRRITHPASGMLLNFCCQSYESAYNLPQGSLAIGLPQVHLRENSRSLAKTKPALDQDLWGAYAVLSDRYDIIVNRTSARERTGNIQRQLVLQSKVPLFFDQHLELSCLTGCTIYTMDYSISRWPDLRLIQPGSMLCGGEICETEADIKRQFEIFERDLKRLEELIRRFSEHPLERDGNTYTGNAENTLPEKKSQ